MEQFKTQTYLTRCFHHSVLTWLSKVNAASHENTAVGIKRKGTIKLFSRASRISSQLFTAQWVSSRNFLKKVVLFPFPDHHCHSSHQQLWYNKDYHACFYRRT